MEMIKPVSFGENFYQYLKEHPYMTVTFEYDNILDGVVMDFRNSTFPSLRSRRCIAAFEIEKALDLDSVFSAMLIYE